MKLSDRYMLTVVTNKSPKATRSDRKATQAIAEDVAAHGGKGGDVGRGIIELYSKGSINSVMTHYHAFNTYHQAVTCEYIGGRGAPRLLSVHRHKDHSDRFYNAKLAFEQAKSQWLKEYEIEVAKARERLGDYFNPADYPSMEAIAHCWDFSCKYMPIADPSAFELGAFSEEQAKALEQQLNDAANRAASEATAEYRQRLKKALDKVASQLRDGKRLHGSLLTNLQALVRADLNVTDDPDIDSALNDAKLVAEPAIAQALADREDHSKNAAASEAEKISRKLSGLS